MMLKKSTPLIFHFRIKNEIGDILPRGGLTIAFNPVENAFGYAICSKDDNFCKRVGINKAVGRSKARDKNKPKKCVVDEEVDFAEVRKRANELAEMVDRAYQVGLGLV